MSPLVESDHEQSATHWCCAKRLKEKGSEATCCICDFHKDCGDVITEKLLLQLLLKDVMNAKYGTKNRAELILRLNELIEIH